VPAPQRPVQFPAVSGNDWAGAPRLQGGTVEVAVRLARPDDSEAIRLIYNVEVETSTVTLDMVPRSADEQRRWLLDRSGAHAVVVAEIDEDVVGFASLSPWRDRPGYRTTVEDSVYVARSHQGQGIGRALLGEVLGVARSHGFHAVMARIGAGHQASLLLHAAYGFRSVGIEREVGRKFGRWIDIEVLQLLLP
jgi:phosphinothricin acetyltransferase